MTKEIAYGRVGFLGNPSDTCKDGRVIAFTFQDFAQVSVEDSVCFKIIGDDGVDTDLSMEKDGNGSNRLIKATIKHLGLESRLTREWPVEITYDSDIAYGSGLSGSSAIIIAAIKALNKHFKLEMNDQRQIAELALHIETDELGIAAGYQDRYIISFGGIRYMSFLGKDLKKAPEEEPYGLVERLKVFYLPCFLCGGTKPKSSAIVHNPLRKCYEQGGETARKIYDQMQRIAELADLGKEALLAGDLVRVGQLMNKNTRLREDLRSYVGKPTMHRKKDLQMISDALKYKALGAKVAGSGGAVIVLTEDKQVLDSMMRKYFCFIPQITNYQENS